MDNIIAYIKEHYAPLSIIVYGSYADGSNNLNSDFDALVISQNHKKHHDTSFFDGISLDVFVYPAQFFTGDFDCSEFIQVFDGKIVLDTDGQGADLIHHIQAYMESLPTKSDAEIRAEIDWCSKMLMRTKRQDTEGMFRWHWVLVDSLEIFCDAVKHPYQGPKKTLRWMEKNHPAAFGFYQKALFDFSEDTLKDWISCLEQL